MSDNHIDVDNVDPSTPEHDAEAHKAQIKAALKAAIEGAKFVASWTPSDFDDKAVAAIGTALESELVIEIIHYIIDGLSPDEAVAAVAAKAAR